MANNDPRDSHILNKNTYQEKYFKLYNNELGDFFNMLTNIHQKGLSSNINDYFGSKEVLPRLKRFFERTQKNWDDSNIIFTNYAQFIAEIYSIFTIGQGIEFIFDKEEKNDVFLEFWKKNKMQNKLKTYLELSIITGYSGGYFKMSDGDIVFQKIDFSNYAPVLDRSHSIVDNEVNLIWILEEKRQMYAYVINFKKIDEEVVITHKAYDYNPSTGFGSERVDFVKRIDKSGVLSPEGVEDNDFKEIPVVMLSSSRKDKYGLGESFIRNLVGNIQDLSINETIGSTELQEHFKSKIAIPESAVLKGRDGTAELISDDYFVVGKNSKEPKYITKDNPFFEPLFKKIELSKKTIAFDTKIPLELIEGGRGGIEKVELAKIRMQPFIMRITDIRGEIDEFVKNLAKIVYKNAKKDYKEFEIKYPPIFKEDEVKTRKDLREELDAGIISRKRYLQITRPTLKEEAIDQILADADKDYGEVKITPNNVDSVGDRL